MYLEQITFIHQQEVKKSLSFPVPLLLKAVKLACQFKPT